MTERQYWNERNGLGIAIDEGSVSLLINIGAELYGIPNSERHVDLERFPIDENQELDPIVKRLERESLEWERSKIIKEISDILWPGWFADYD